MSIVWAVGFVLGLAALIGLWFVGGVVLKTLVLFAPSSFTLLAGMVLVFLYPGLITGILLIVTIVVAFLVYQSWEGSDAFGRIESQLDTLFRLD